MSSCCSIIAEHFNTGVAESDLKRFRRKGPDHTTRLLRDFVERAGGGRTLLDVGGGIGALSFELLKSGFEQATILDVAPAYLAAARNEAVHQGLADRVTIREGDFVTAGNDFPVVDAVVMDRVVCCYPAFEPLLEEALRHSRRLFAFSYPRDRWYVRLPVALQNAVRTLRGSSFRMRMHSESAMHALAERHRFRCVGRGKTTLWSVRIYAIRDAAS